MNPKMEVIYWHFRMQLTHCCVRCLSLTCKHCFEQNQVLSNEPINKAYERLIGQSINPLIDWSLTERIRGKETERLKRTNKQTDEQTERKLRFHIINTHLRCCKEVHFQQPGLQMIFSWSVVLKSIQQERCTCLYLVGFHKDIYNLKQRENTLLWDCSVDTTTSLTVAKTDKIIMILAKTE